MVRCFFVKIKSITRRGGAYLIHDYNGNMDYFPVSTVYDSWCENEVFIAEWILKKKSITYSSKKAYWYNPKKHIITPEVIIEVIKTTPKKVEFDPNSQPNKELLK